MIHRPELVLVLLLLLWIAIIHATPRFSMPSYAVIPISHETYSSSMLVYDDIHAIVVAVRVCLLSWSFF